jgi:tRNA-splicing ligase RtcB (3'-phosphate/5'-hydroxy nucleic acid ligase)
MIEMISKAGRANIHLWAPAAEVEPQALQQLENIAALPWVFHHVAVMPDVHYGKGATVGSVVAMKGAVSPAAVGVDIGCGMGAIETNLRAYDLPDNLETLRTAIEESIPVGFNSHSVIRSERFYELFLGFSELSSKVQDLRDRALLQLGTLGGGNHFIELCLDTKQRVWMMLHSGSRNIGKTLAEIHIGAAKKLAHNADLPDPDLAVFLSGTPEMDAYRRDLFWAQRYAMENRSTMFDLYKDVMRSFFQHVAFGTPILCHHNYVSEERHFGQDVIVTRKGAIRAGRGEMGIIPGSMGTKSYIVRGLGNADSFESASHGAGRRMSRGAAKRKFTVADLAAQTEGVCCRKDADVVDEIPGAYKPIESVMKNQADLVEVVAELKQVLCVKG